MIMAISSRTVLPTTFKRISDNHGRGLVVLFLQVKVTCAKMFPLKTIIFRSMTNETQGIYLSSILGVNINGPCHGLHMHIQLFQIFSKHRSYRVITNSPQFGPKQ